MSRAGEKRLGLFSAQTGHLFGHLSGQAPSGAEIFAVFVIMASVVVFPSLAADPGLGWHLRAGEQMLADRALIVSEPFLYPDAENFWVLNQWAAEIVGAAVYHLGGWGALHMLTYLVVWGAHLLVPLLLVHDAPLGSIGRVAGLLPAVLLGSLQWMIRPQIASFLLFGVTLLLARRCLNERLALRWAGWTLPILFLAWANLHPGFLVGLLVLVAAEAEFLAKGEWRRAIYWSAISAVSFLATLCNPMGIGLYSASLGLIADPYFMQLMAEWQPISWGDPFFLPFWCLLAVLLAGFLWWLWTGRGAVLLSYDWLIVLWLALASLEHRRFLPFLGVAAVLPIAASIEYLHTALRNAKSSRPVMLSPFTPLSMVVGVLLCGALWAQIPAQERQARALGAYFPEAPVAKLNKRVEASSAEIFRVFNNPNWGGLIVFGAGPRVRVFADDRNEVSSAQRYRDYFAIADATPEGLQKFEDLRFDAVLLGPQKPLSELLRADGRFELAYSGPDAALFIRR